MILPRESNNHFVAVRLAFRKECFRCSMICPWKAKLFSLLYDLSLERNSVFVETLGWKNVFIAVCYVIISVKFYYTMYDIIASNQFNLDTFLFFSWQRS